MRPQKKGKNKQNSKQTWNPQNGGHSKGGRGWFKYRVRCPCCSEPKWKLHSYNKKAKQNEYNRKRKYRTKNHLNVICI